MPYGTVKVDTIVTSTQSVSVDGLAPKASPAFTGTPTAPTAAANTSTTQIATTAYVVNQGYLKTSTASSTYAPKASPTFTSDIELSGQAPVRFMDADSSHWVALRAPASVTANVTWTLPSTDGSSGTVLTTDGSGNLSWATGGASIGLAVALG